MHFNALLFYHLIYTSVMSIANLASFTTTGTVNDLSLAGAVSVARLPFGTSDPAEDGDMNFQTRPNAWFNGQWNPYLIQADLENLIDPPKIFVYAATPGITFPQTVDTPIDAVYGMTTLFSKNASSTNGIITFNTPGYYSFAAQFGICGSASYSIVVTNRFRVRAYLVKNASNYLTRNELNRIGQWFSTYVNLTGIYPVSAGDTVSMYGFMQSPTTGLLGMTVLGGAASGTDPLGTPLYGYNTYISAFRIAPLPTISHDLLIRDDAEILQMDEPIESTDVFEPCFVLPEETDEQDVCDCSSETIPAELLERCDNAPERLYAEPELLSRTASECTIQTMILPDVFAPAPVFTPEHEQLDVLTLSTDDPHDSGEHSVNSWLSRQDNISINGDGISKPDDASDTQWEEVSNHSYH